MGDAPKKDWTKLVMDGKEIQPCKKAKLTDTMGHEEIEKMLLLAKPTRKEKK